MFTQNQKLSALSTDLLAGDRSLSLLRALGVASVAGSSLGGPIKRRIKTDAIRIELTITFQVKLRLTNRNTFGREIFLFEQLISHAVLTTSRFDHALEVI